MTITITSQASVRPHISHAVDPLGASSPLPSRAPSSASRILAPIGAAAAGAGVMYLWARSGPPKLRLGLMTFGAAAGAGITAMVQGQRAAEVHPYLVSFSTHPDFSQSQGTPASVYQLLNRHFAKVSPPVATKLAQLRDNGIVHSYEGIPISNGYIVNVRNDKVKTFEREILSTSNVGGVEAGDE